MSEAELTQVREAHQFDQARLEEYLSDEVEGYQGPFEIQQFEGGQSNPTFKLITANQKYVLRKQPPGELLPSAHQVAREHRVMHALRDTEVPVPEMVCLCEDKSVIGTSFYVMKFVEGRVFPVPFMPDCQPSERREVYLNLVRILGTLHGVNPEAVGLGDFGRPGNYFERQINRWGKQYIAAQTDDLPDMLNLIEWLPKNIPDDNSAGIAHGDYRLGNVLVNPDNANIDAVLDWELCTLGHPLSDLGYLCQAYYGDDERSHTGLPANFAELGIPQEQELLDEYCKVTGRGEIKNWEFYVVFNMFRSASIIQGVYKRGLDGNASSEAALGFKDAARQISSVAWAKIQAM